MTDWLPGSDARRLLERRVDDVAHRLLGARLTSDLGGQRVVVRIVEVEAYREDDPASHTFRGQTSRNRVMFGPPGFAYVYFTYGMHHCMNVSCEPEGRGAAVLLRAGEVIEGMELATRRRGGRGGVQCASGPARLTQAVGVDRSEDGVDLLSEDGPLRLEIAARPVDHYDVGPRVGVRQAADVPWRFRIPNNPSTSRYTRHPKAPPPPRPSPPRT